MRFAFAIVASFALVALLVAAPAVRAEPTPIEFVVSGNEATATLSLTTSALTTVEADLTLTFETVVGLTSANLGGSIEEVPVDTSFLERLPADLLEGVSVVPAGGLPILLRIEPPASGGLAFEGVVEISLYTHDLHYTAGSGLRIFAATGGHDFVDITSAVGSGSYRATGTKGGFSEFLIGVDPRPSARVAEAKLDRLDTVLAAYQALIAPAVLSSLGSLLGEIESLYGAGSYADAIDKVDDFAEKVEEHSGDDVPNVWQAGGGTVNVAGELREVAATLRFSLSLLANS